jgi:hypothetical protein
VLEQTGELAAGELATPSLSLGQALVRVENFGLAVLCQRLLQSLDAKLGAEGVRQPPRQHGAAHPIHDYHQVKKAPSHRDVGDVGAPDLIDPLDRQPAEQIRVDLVLRRRFARVRPLVDRHQPHQPHQPLDSFAVDQVALRRKPCRHPARAVIRPRQILPVDQRHDRAVLLADLGRSAIDRSAGYHQQPALL